MATRTRQSSKRGSRSASSLEAPAAARLTPSERAHERLMLRWMERTGFDTGALAKLHARRRREVAKEIETRRRSALAQAAAIDATSKARIRQFAAAKGLDIFTVPTFTLDKPIRISASPRSILKSAKIQPFDSFAKIRTKRTSSGTDRVSFIYRFINQSLEPVAIDAITLVSASGFLDMNVHGGLFYHWGTLDPTAQISIHVTSGDEVVHETHLLPGAVLAVNHPLAIGDGREARGCHDTFNLTALHHFVPPLATARIRISLLIEADCGSGFESDADFASGQLRVGCPLCVVRVHKGG